MVLNFKRLAYKAIFYYAHLVNSGQKHGPEWSQQGEGGAVIGRLQDIRREWNPYPFNTHNTRVLSKHTTSVCVHIDHLSKHPQVLVNSVSASVRLADLNLWMHSCESRRFARIQPNSLIYLKRTDREPELLAFVLMGLIQRCFPLPCAVRCVYGVWSSRPPSAEVDY